jgi:hypothetical protein
MELGRFGRREGPNERMSERCVKTCRQHDQRTSSKLRHFAYRRAATASDSRIGPKTVSKLETLLASRNSSHF